MSSTYVTLPPLWETWTYEDVQKMTVEDLWRLHLIVFKKMEFVEEQIEIKALFESRNIDVRRKKTEDKKEKEEGRK